VRGADRTSMFQPSPGTALDDGSLDLEHLADHVAWFTANLELRVRAHRGEEPGPDAAHLLGTMAQTQARITARGAIHPDLGATRLRSRLGLSETEEQVVWLLTAIAVDGDARTLAIALAGGSAPDPTLEVLRLVVYGARPSRRAFAELGPDAPLRRLALIERSDGGGADVHETKHTFTLARRVLALLHGDASPDPALACVSIPGAAPALSQLAIDETAAALLVAAVAAPTGQVVVASGPPGVGRRTSLLSAATAAGLEVLQVNARALSRDPARLVEELRRVARECRLLDRVPLVVNIEALSPTENVPDRVPTLGAELAAAVPGPVLVTAGAQPPALRWDRPVVVVELLGPTSAQRGALWLAALGDGTPEDAAHLAGQYPLAPALIHAAARAARSRAIGPRVTPADIQAGVRSVLDDKLGGLARRSTTSQTWDDLVLPSDQLAPVTELIARVRERSRVYEDWGFARKVGKGLGVSALFSGPPGTGKTMIAALIARDLGLELYQVDLAKVVSKWIGETEKQLGALFDAAEAGHAILLFDEADSLFGKRTDVKSSNDRYANQETNYLLQRLESFTGICLLTTNHESSIDQAFQRRLSLHVRFTVPDAGERLDLWRAMLPPAAPVEAQLGLKGLAQQFEMSGGYIRNATLRAAFLAADERVPINAAHLRRAAEIEYDGMGKIAVSAGGLS